MKFTSAIALLAAFASPALATLVNVTYDQTYDNPSTSLASTACSNGVNGLETKGYTTLGSLPSFPYIGGIPGLTWNSTLCGTCWKLAYDPANGTAASINILAVDAAFTYNIALEAMNNLTSGQAVALGKVQATATQVDASVCGL
ncbi:hypothetical protein SERLA73DRAFT_170704 [Serpula lacrymans var. lacrymans S7.3]|uniref:Cerato-platanin n=2 Tax=Serpula lacrymans var. lacrymans TaxID=341189 RepID=F8Q6S2_SERL3|nr:uncharacterized protein SERLADRAFT_474818 [Serpula lacrymans var. lacrymans S7.9]EGN96310.1 hypothetical protein SERLA73DRAFT_170704 [Serpula lacrymans var. lacrymans S7.3]EGO21846.1 hypothetical protein SERLADRAFT_474818 [Serpula lacrymans var. lacrymans S7.9]